MQMQAARTMRAPMFVPVMLDMLEMEKHARVWKSSVIIGACMISKALTSLKL